MPVSSVSRRIGILKEGQQTLFCRACDSSHLHNKLDQEQMQAVFLYEESEEHCETLFYNVSQQRASRKTCAGELALRQWLKEEVERAGAIAFARTSLG